MSGETPMPQIAEVRATHFGPKGEVLVNPPKEQAKPAERRFLGFLLKQKQELPKPEGPKHVLEALQELDIEDRVDQAVKSLVKIASEDTKSTNDENEYFSVIRGGVKVRVNAIAQARSKRETQPSATGTPDTFTAIPTGINSIFKELNGSDNPNPIVVEDIEISSHFIRVRSSNDITVNIILPRSEIARAEPNNALHLTVDMHGQIINDQLRAALRAIKERYSNKDKLIEVSNELVTYTEGINKQLPNEVQMRQEERKQEKVEKHHATPEDIQLTETQQKYFDELRARHPNNHLFNNNFIGVPENYVSVFRVVREDTIDQTADLGLKAKGNEESEQDEQKKADFAKFAPLGFSRETSIYAFPDFNTVNTNSAMLNELRKSNNVVLEIKVDPTKVRVADMWVYDGYRQDDSQEERDRITREYWENSRALQSYRYNPAKSSADYGKISMPEVLIPDGVDKKYIRVSSVIVPNRKITYED